MPAPAITEDTRPFWDACRRRELVVQRCADCGSFRHPPAPVCWFASSVVFGVSNEVPTLPYTVTASDGVTATPSDPDKARISRSPESSGFVGLMNRSCTLNFTQS